MTPAKCRSVSLGREGETKRRMVGIGKEKKKKAISTQNIQLTQSA